MKKYYTRWVVKAAQLTSKMCLVNIIKTALVIEKLWDKTWQDIVASRMIFVAAAEAILHTRLLSFLVVICKSCASLFVCLFFFFRVKRQKLNLPPKVTTFSRFSQIKNNWAVRHLAETYSEPFLIYHNKNNPFVAAFEMQAPVFVANAW